MNIEPLEARIAPASAFVTYTDVDGDLVKISATTPGALPLSFAGNLNFVGGGTAGQLARLNLSDLSFSGANVTFTGTKAATGDGFGNADDAVVNLPPGAGTDAIIAQIASISIKGHVLGTAGGTDHFGFVARQIGSFKTSGFTAPLTLAAANQNILIPLSNDVRILEV